MERFPDAVLVEHQPPGVGRVFRVQSGIMVLGEGRGPALAWRGAARRVLGDAGLEAAPKTPPGELIRRAVEHLIEARALLESAGAEAALAAVRSAIDACGVRPVNVDV